MSGEEKKDEEGNFWISFNSLMLLGITFLWLFWPVVISLVFYINRNNEGVEGGKKCAFLVFCIIGVFSVAAAAFFTPAFLLLYAVLGYLQWAFLELALKVRELHLVIELRQDVPANNILATE